MAVIMRRGEFLWKHFGRYHRRHTIFPNTIQLRLLSSSSSSSRPSSEKNAQTLEKSIWGSGTYADDVATITDVTLPELIWSNVRKWEDLPAYECGVTGRGYTHGEIFTKSRAFGAALLQSGLKPGDVVAIMLPNVPEYAIALLGAIEVGLIVSPVNPTSTLYEVQNQLGNCRAKCVVTIDAFVPLMEQVKKSGVLKSIVAISADKNVPEGAHCFFQMLQADPSSVEFLTGNKIDVTQETCLIPYSSGTTGPPKGVELTHSNVATNLIQHLSPKLTVKRRYDQAGEQDRIIGILPFHHIFALNCVLLSTLYMGSHCLTLPKFDPVSYVKAFRTHKPTVAHLVTPILNFMVHSREFTPKELQPLRAVVAGAAPVGSHIVRGLMAKCNDKFFYQEGYGMTEMSPPNQVGELCIKGPQVMKGYFENEQATRESFDSDGYLKTGDVGYFDEDGYLYIVDRLKELIKVKGSQVAPSELENLIRQVPGVLDCAVIGIPSESSGELPRAYVVKGEKSSVTDKDINGYLQDKVSKYKRLAGGVEFIGAIPKAASGKILRRELKKLYEEGKTRSGSS